MNQSVAVRVVATDPLLAEGAASALNACAEITVAGPFQPPEVAVVMTDDLGPAGIQLVQAVRESCPGVKVVLVASAFGPDEAVRAIEAGVTGLLLRRDAHVDALCRTVVAVASGDCAVPLDVLGQMLEDGAALASAAASTSWSPAPLSDRERAVLGLVADGQETGEIARQLCYSVRTVTSIMHAVTQRFRVRNRAHAVAYALRAGLL
jgi:DNA-binding NarL/FixJ family response regulator